MRATLPPDGRARDDGGLADRRPGCDWRRLRRRAAWAASLFAVLFLQACRTATQGFPVRYIQPDTHAQHGQEDRTGQPNPPAGGNEGARP